MENEILLDKSKVQGQIYLITNIQNQKKYVGQTLTHRKNHGKYRPFGIQGRFNDHLSEAICNTKKKQCRYLNNAIRHYGKEFFTVSLITNCQPSELDEYEKYYIEEYNTLYPNGYNLTRGGKTTEYVKADDVSKLETTTPGIRGGCEMRSEKTRNKISEQLKKVLGTEENRKRQMSVTKEQHKTQKYDRFKNEKIDLENLDKYLYIKHAKGIPFVVVKVNGKQTSFVGKFQTLEELQQQAREFLQTIANMTATLSN
jgi:group I intron endonuclease